MSDPIGSTAVVDANEARRREIRVRPGLLVNLVTRLEGGVEYHREEKGADRIGPRLEGELIQWETEKRIADTEEYKAAATLRGRVRSMVRGACIWTPFGMICPLDNEPLLVERIAEAHRLVDAFNATAVHTRVRFPEPLRGRIAEDTREAVAAVRGEIHNLIGELQSALQAGAVETIRDVAQKATQMGRLLEEGTEARTALDRAVKESRRVATELVKRIEEGAGAAAEILAGANVKLVSTARLAFAEDEMGEITDAAPSMPTAAVTRFGALEEEYVPPPPAPEPEPVSPGVTAGEALSVMVTDALREFGEYSYDDRGPDEVMDVSAAYALVANLEPAQIAEALGLLVTNHVARGVALAEAITDRLPEGTAQAVAAALGSATEEGTATTGVVVPLANAATLLARPPAAPAAPEETYDEDEIV